MRLITKQSIQKKTAGWDLTSSDVGIPLHSPKSRAEQRAEISCNATCWHLGISRLRDSLDLATASYLMKIRESEPSLKHLRPGLGATHRELKSGLL